MDTRFGKYVVERELGRGGFGRVYCAFDADMNRRVAIKVLACESDADLMSRFQAEAGMTARLAHRNIITVYEFAQQDGLPYLVMELLEGRTLYEIIGSGVLLPLLEKAEIMYQVAEGLQHAHQRVSFTGTLSRAISCCFLTGG
jgi:serine/threonine protein kinase